MPLEWLNGSWVQGDVEGDVEKWMESQGADFMAMQFAKATGWGKDQQKLHMLVHDGTLYVEQDIMGGKFHRTLKLGAGETRAVVVDGCPLISPKTVWMQIAEAPSGVLETKTLLDNKDPFAETQNSAGDDGNSSVVRAKLAMKDGEAIELTTHWKREAGETMTLDYVQGWCPFTVYPMASSPSAPDKTSVLTASLEGHFSSSDHLMDALVDVWKHKEPASNEKSVTLVETSEDTEFKYAIVLEDDQECSLGYKVDKGAGTAEVAFTGTDGNLACTTHWSLLKDPLRVEVFQMWGEFRRADIFPEVEDQVWGALKRSSK